MNERARPDPLLREKLRCMIDGYRISQVVIVAAQLRLADLLQDGPKRADELAATIRVDPCALARVLRTLASVGIVERIGADRFVLAPLGEWLRSGTDESLYPWALFSARMYRAWGDFLESIESGKGGLGSGHGKRRWEHLGQSPEDVRIFHDAMGAISSWVVRAVLEVYDFSAFGCIVDVGGANGALITSILSMYPGAQGIVFDLPEAVGEAGPRLEAARLAARCQVRAGSFFDFVPPGGDAYLLSRVLHDWDNDHAEQILQSTRRAMASGKTLLIIERLLDPECPSVEASLSDLSMLLMNGGCERSCADYESLLAAAGFKLARVVATPEPVQILEALAI